MSIIMLKEMCVFYIEDSNNSYLTWISFSLLIRGQHKENYNKLRFLTKESERILVMSLNQSDYDAMFKKYINVLDEFSMADIVVKIAYKYRDWYGEWGLIFVRYVTPYFWVFPFIGEILMMMSFKRLNLFGPMQKCLVAIMVIDVFFSFIDWFKRLRIECFKLESWLYWVQRLYVYVDFHSYSNCYSRKFNLDQITDAVP